MAISLRSLSKLLRYIVNKCVKISAHLPILQLIRITQMNLRSVTCLEITRAQAKHQENRIVHIKAVSGQRYFAPGHSEHLVSDRVFGMTFYPGQLSLRTPCLFFLMPGDRNEHLLLEILMKRRCEMSPSRCVAQSLRD
jgi:hypothetical protein